MAVVTVILTEQVGWSDRKSPLEGMGVELEPVSVDSWSHGSNGSRESVAGGKCGVEGFVRCVVWPHVMLSEIIY